MKRLKTVPMAIGAMALAAGTVAAFSTLPDAAGPGLQKASDASGKTAPERAIPDGVPPPSPAVEPAVVEPAVALPDAGSHGATFSAASRAEYPTPDTNYGADLS